MDLAISMHTPRRQRAAIRVDREFAIEGDPVSALDEVARPVALAKAEILQPVDRVETEPVVELGYVHVAWLQVCPAPHHFGYFGLGLRCERVELRPAVAILHIGADRLEAQQR